MAKQHRAARDYPWWADPRFPYDPKWGWVIKSEHVTEWGRGASEALKYGFEGGMMTDEPWGKLAKGGFIVERDIAKRGYTVGFSWDALIESRGHSEPIGVRWIQRVRYALLIPVFHFSKWLSGRVERSRHVSAAFGYEYEESELRPFSQKTRWVNDD